MVSGDPVARLFEGLLTLLVSVILFGRLLYDFLPTTSAPIWAKAVLLTVIPISELIILVKLPMLDF